MKLLLSLFVALYHSAPPFAQEPDGAARTELNPGQVWTIEGEGQAAAWLTIPSPFEARRPSRRR